MKVEHEFYIGLRDIDRNNKLTIKSLMSFFEDVGGIHSNLAGYGLYDIDKKNCNWVIISWKVKFIKKPSYNETIKVVTWSKSIQRLYAYRDFEVFNQNGERIAIASSKWVLVNFKTKSIITPDEELVNSYSTEPDSVMDIKELTKLKEPNNYINSYESIVTRDMIDMNNHVHNLNYLDFAYNALPDDIYYLDFNSVEIMYKKEIKLNDKVKSLYSFSKEDNSHVITIKNSEESLLHAIIKLK